MAKLKVQPLQTKTTLHIMNQGMVQEYDMMIAICKFSCEVSMKGICRLVKYNTYNTRIQTWVRIKKQSLVIYYHYL